MPEGAWALAEGPLHYGFGIQQLATSVDAEIHAVEEAIAATSIDALARQATAIVIGRVGPVWKRAVLNGVALKCAEVIPDSTIAGIVPNGALRVYALPYGAVSHHQSAVLFLRAGEAPGTHQIVEFNAGILSVRNGVVERLQIGLSSLVRQVRTARGQGN